MGLMGLMGPIGPGISVLYVLEVLFGDAPRRCFCRRGSRLPPLMPPEPRRLLQTDALQQGLQFPVIFRDLRVGMRVR